MSNDGVDWNVWLSQKGREKKVGKEGAFRVSEVGTLLWNEAPQYDETH